MFRSVNLSNPVHPEAVVIGCYEGSDVSAAEAPEVQEAVRRPGFQAKVGEIVEAFPSGSPRIIVLGLGTKESLSSDVFRKVSGCLIRHIDKEKLERVDLRISSLRDPAMMGRCFGEAAGLLGWNCSTYRGTGTDPEEQIDLELGGNDEEFAEGIQRGLSLASASNLARELVFTPPEVATPAYMAKQAEMLANATGMECRVIEGDELAKEKLNGLRAVGRASDNKPCLIRLKYTPEGGSDLRPVVLIGKTITYDTGGLSLKGKTGMPGMKVDKGGGCAVLGAMKAIAEVIKPDFPVIALLPAAENFVSSNSYRPDDVIEYRNGVTVEVTNTDAEGRLVLADALCWAADEDPVMVVDLATLTGGVVTALGNEFAGYFTENDMLAADLEEAGRVSGEKVWRLPLSDGYKKMMKSPIADILNSNLNGRAHPVQGATFLTWFAPADVPWAHIDIAGMANSDTDLDMLPKGPTGFGVRFLADLLRTRPSVLPLDW